MSTKNKKMLLGSVVVNVLGLVLIFIALPIEKLSVLWFAAFICGFISLVAGLYVSEKKKTRVGGAAQIKATKQVSGTLSLDLAQYRELQAFGTRS